MKTHRILAALLLALTFGQPLPRLLAAVQGEENPATQFAKSMFLATKMISEDHIKPVSQAEQVRWVVAGLFQAAKEPVPKGISERLAKLDKANEKELLSVLKDARTHLGKWKEIEAPNDVEIALQAITDKIDPGFKHPTWGSIQLNMGGVGHPIGVGLNLQADPKSGFPKVLTPVFGSSAYKAGIRAGDLIQKIEDMNQKDDDGNGFFLTKGIPVPLAEKWLLGPMGSKVKLSILRPKDTKPRVVELTREWVQQETVLGIQRNKDDSWDYYFDTKAKICYARLSQLSTNTSRDLEKLMKELSKTGINGFILDLRFNPGGLLVSAIRVSDLFIDDGLIVTIKKRTGPWTSYVGKSEGSHLQFPMACLVNGESARSSEYVAACLQDHGRAIIMGERSAGKAEVRTLNDIDGAILSMPTAAIYRPSGKNLSKYMADGTDIWGVQPNLGFALKLPAKEQQQLAAYLEDKLILRPPNDKGLVFTDRQLDMAVDYLRELLKNKSK